MSEPRDQHPAAPEPDELDDDTRREVLAKIGRLAYVAPALMVLTEPKRAQAGYGGGGGGGNGNGGGNSHGHGHG